MKIDLILACVCAAVASGCLVNLFVRAVLGARSALEAGGGVRALLAFPAAIVARRRTLDRELDRQLADLEKLRVQAGCRYLEGATAPEIFAARFVFPLLAVAFIVAFGLVFRLPGGLLFLGAVFFGAMLYVYPASGLKAAATARTVRFTHDLPMALDVMRLVCQAGGDLQSAVKSTVAVLRDSPVREELVRAINEMTIGTPLARALSNVGERIATPDANAVFSTLSQALEMGTSVTDNLRAASDLIRHSLRIKAQARAQKAVVAMTFPLLLLILPGVFIVLFAPMIIQFVNQ